MTQENTFWFIRHAESEGNIGLPTNSAAEIAITEKGKIQAECIANYLTSPPDLFVVSEYQRTHQTAIPTLEKFPSVPVETWNIKEFTYLPHELYANKTTAQRNEPSFEYFRKGDPDLVLGDGGESFNQMIARVDDTLQKMVSSTVDKTILFCHGWFMRALLWRLIFFNHFCSRLELADLKNKLPTAKLFFGLFNLFWSKIRRSEMKHFLLFSTIIFVPNGSIMKFTVDPETQSINLLELDLSHLSKDLQGSRFVDR
jgi:broad specificity phosphatase PhoE